MTRKVKYYTIIFYKVHFSSASIHKEMRSWKVPLNILKNAGFDVENDVISGVLFHLKTICWNFCYHTFDNNFVSSNNSNCDRKFTEGKQLLTSQRALKTFRKLIAWVNATKKDGQAAALGQDITRLQKRII